MADSARIPARYLKPAMAYARLDLGGRMVSFVCEVVRHDVQPKKAWGSFAVHDEAGYGANYVLQGRGTFTDWNGNSYELKPGSFYQRVGGRPHQTEMHEAPFVECYVYPSDGFRLTLIDLGIVDLKTPVRQIGIDLNIVARYRQLIQDTNQGRLTTRQTVIAIQELVRLLFESGGVPSEDPWDGVIREACRLLESDVHVPLEMSRVAEQLGCAYSTFRQQFQLRTGYSPVQYRIRKRLALSAELLERIPIKEVALALGYCDAYAFSAQFKKHYGMSPRAFRHRLRHLDDRFPLPRSLALS